jgi:hypothetical protein
MCWQNKYGKWLDIDNHPTPGIAVWDVMVRTVDGNVGSITFKFHHYDYPKMEELLKAKYGAPTSEDRTAVQNRMGATFDSLEMEWAGATMTLNYFSRAGKVDEGLVALTTKRYVESQKFDTEKNKSKL